MRDLIGSIISSLVQRSVQVGDGLGAVAHTRFPAGSLVALPIFKSVLDPPEVFLVFGFFVLLDGVIHGLQPGAPGGQDVGTGIFYPLPISWNAHATLSVFRNFCSKLHYHLSRQARYQMQDLHNKQCKPSPGLRSAHALDRRLTCNRPDCLDCKRTDRRPGKGPAWLPGDPAV